MNTNDAVQILKKQFTGKDWFFDAEPDHNHAVVYVKFSNQEVMRAIPDKVEGIPVLMHFALSKISNSNQYITNAGMPKFATPEPKVEILVIDEPLPKGVERAEYLTDELDRLSEICGDNVLQDIMFEVHDGKNAITNLSAKYPEVREEMEQLYEEFGFDALNREWE
jgi:hypothetical protein